MPRTDAANESACPSCGSWWRLPLLLAVVLAAMIANRSWNAASSSSTNLAGEAAVDAAAPPGRRVHLAIDFADGGQRAFPAVGWSAGMTVADLLAKVPGVQIALQGSGEAAFLVSINGVANAAAEGRFWTYEVNGRAADRSFAVYELQPGDRVLWSFGSER